MKRIFSMTVAMMWLSGGLPAQEPDMTWRTAGGNYLDPTSFFTLHGYVNAVYAGGSADWLIRDPTQLGAPGQLLVPNTSTSGFQFDAAAFLSSEISQTTRVMVEAHLVPDPSGTGQTGPGGLTIALTEATASWDVFDKYLTLSGGLFWAPFGIVNWDWLGAQNLFTLIPRASVPFPTHFNERGFRANGAIALSNRVGISYVASVGNGVRAFDLSGQTSTDDNDDKTVMGRVALFPGFGRHLEIGYSVARGDLQTDGDPTAPANDPDRYPSEFHAHGGDVTARAGGWSGRGYFIRSTQTLASTVGLRRTGAMAEMRYRVHLGWVQPSLLAVAPKVRVDWAEADELNAQGTGLLTSHSTVYSVGSDFEPAEKFRLSVEYHFQRESATAAPLNNDRFIVRLTGQF